MPVFCKNQVAVSIFGGLGNQLFQYATGLSVARKLESDLILDVSWFDNANKIPGHTPRCFCLNNYIGHELKLIRQGGDFFYSSTGLINKSKKIRGKAVRWLQGFTVCAESGFNFDSRIFERKSPLWLVGYWQSSRYFESIAPELKRTLRNARLSAKNVELFHQITNSYSICIHVRRGDYLLSSSHPVLDFNYYLNGLDIVTQNVINPVCYVFSDDPCWVKNNIQTYFPLHVVDCNGPNEADQDLLLMSACKRFIIANSTLSWWGAWLGDYPGKRVVCPRNWFKSDDKDVSDLIPADWIII